MHIYRNRTHEFVRHAAHGAARRKNLGCAKRETIRKIALACEAEILMVVAQIPHKKRRKKIGTRQARSN